MPTIVSGKEREVRFGPGLPTVAIGERINPTGLKKLAESLAKGDLDLLLQEAFKQKSAGADIIDVNVGVPGIEEGALLARAVKAVMAETGLPVCIDSADPEAIAAALKAYPYKALINSVTGEEKSLQSILPLVREYGAAVVVMPVDGNGIPKTASQRMAVAGKIVDRAESLGIPREDIVVDCLAIAASADMTSAMASIEAIRIATNELALSTTMGVSNISFGMPQRKIINNTFLAVAIEAGLSAAIVDPTDEPLLYTLLSANFLAGRDEYASKFLSYYRARL